eukprot:6482709-Amphidinium_carterae.1
MHNGCTLTTALTMCFCAGAPIRAACWGSNFENVTCREVSPRGMFSALGDPLHVSPKLQHNARCVSSHALLCPVVIFTFCCTVNVHLDRLQPREGLGTVATLALSGPQGEERTLKTWPDERRVRGGCSTLGVPCLAGSKL